MKPLLPHHQATLDRALDHYSKLEPFRALVLGGSVAKGLAKEDSDVDLLVVVEDGDFQRRIRDGELMEVRFDLADYPGGYTDAKFFSPEALEIAAERASEPTRNAMVGARVVCSKVPGLEDVLDRIATYPEHEREAKIRSFHAQITLQLYFVGESEKRGDPFLAAYASSRMVQFAGRLILAKERVLFPSEKRLLETVAAAPGTPPEFLTLADQLVRKPNGSTARRLADLILAYAGLEENWPVILSQYSIDHEIAWYFGKPSLCQS